ncbi:MAG: NAD(P)/FAD-dependent oxidoreductase [Pseudomonadota bacterium]|nr:NAD(P)/FAD-dependent oxidoreductase [Pseudomonadota bacterium]
MTDYDVIVIGGGHNGLTCGAYLAQAGLKVAVLEKRGVVGGAAITEEFHPGFRNSVYSYSVSLLHPQVIRDLRLEQHGLEILERPAGTLSLLNGDHLLLSRDAQQARQEIARFSKHDAKRIDAFEEEISAVALAMRRIAASAPPELNGGWADLFRLGATGWGLRQLSGTQRTVLAELMTKSLGDYLDRWFEGASLKGVLGLEGVIGNFADPYQQGTAYVLLHHAFGEVNGRTGAWGIAKGGMGAITQAMADALTSARGTIETACAVQELLVDECKGGHRVRGVLLADGRKLQASAVVGGVHPQTLLLHMGAAEFLNDADRRRIEGYRSHSATFRMNVALAELPKFESLPRTATEHFLGAIEISPSLEYLRKAFLDAKDTGWSRQPVISMQVPSTQDNTLAPAGAHVASLFCQHFQRHLPDGQSWDDVKESVADHVIATVDAYAPNFKASVLARQIKSPLDIERDLGMVGGDIFHGTLHLDQIYSLRPIPGWAGYQMPLERLYLCGSGAHPGGGVTGLPGKNAARKILSDRKAWA